MKTEKNLMQLNAHTQGTVCSLCCCLARDPEVSPAITLDYGAASLLSLWHCEKFLFVIIWFLGVE